MSDIYYLIKPNSVVIGRFDGAPLHVESDHINYGSVLNAIADGDLESALEFAKPVTMFNNLTQAINNVAFDGHTVTVNNLPFDNYIVQRIKTFHDEGLPFEPLLRFLGNLLSNPSRTSIQELYLFLEAANLPITDDGHFLAYKSVRPNFYDWHTGTFDNSPGQKPFMERNMVDDNRERTCSVGFHASSYRYATNFHSDGRLVVVKINPANVVSVPKDERNEKLRVNTYEVLYEVVDRADQLTNQRIKSL